MAIEKHDEKSTAMRALSGPSIACNLGIAQFTPDGAVARNMPFRLLLLPAIVAEWVVTAGSRFVRREADFSDTLTGLTLKENDCVFDV